MGEVEDIIARVVSESGKTEADIKEKVKTRKEKTHGLLSDYGAVYAVAKELGVDLDGKQAPLTKIKEVSGQKNLNVLGRVKVVFSPREFNRKDGTTGYFASIILLDDSGEIRLVLWDKNTELTKHIQVGDAILAKNVYSKDNQGAFEIHAGSLSTININPKTTEAKLPEISEKLYKIKELTEDNPAVNIVLRVSNYLPKTEFTRSDGSTGSRASFIGEDESGKIRVVLWDKSAEREIGDGDILKLENAYTRKGFSEDIELQAGNRSRIIETEIKLKLPPLETKAKASKLSELKQDESSLTVEARVLRVFPPRDYSGGSMASIIMGDDSGTIRAVFWDEKSGEAEKLSRGDAVVIQNAYTRANMNDEVEVHVGKYGIPEKSDKSKLPSPEDIELKFTKTKTISELEPSEDRVRVSAKIVDLEEDRNIFYMTCPSCNGKVQNLGGAWFCDACGDIDPDSNLVVSSVLEDDSGTIRGVFFRENAEKILGLDAESAMNLIGETQDETAPLKEAKKKLKKTPLTLLGRARYNDFSDQLEFIVDELS